jgi:hypothetical protein
MLETASDLQGIISMHESGHLVASWLLGQPIERVVLRRTGETMSATTSRRDRPQTDDVDVADLIHRLATVGAAGFVAEERYRRAVGLPPDDAGGKSDRAKIA